MKRRPTRLRARTRGRAARKPSSPLGHRSPAAAPRRADISGQHSPAACLAVPVVRAGIGRRRVLRAIDRRRLARRRHRMGASCPAAPAAPPRRSSRPGGARAIMSAAPAVEHFQELVDLGLPVAFAAGMEGVRHAMLQVVAAASPARPCRGRRARRGSGSARRCSSAPPRSCAPRRAPGPRCGRAGRAGISSISHPSLNHTPVWYR